MFICIFEYMHENTVFNTYNCICINQRPLGLLITFFLIFLIFPEASQSKLRILFILSAQGFSKYLRPFQFCLAQWNPKLQHLIVVMDPLRVRIFSLWVLSVLASASYKQCYAGKDNFWDKLLSSSVWAKQHSQNCFYRVLNAQGLECGQILSWLSQTIQP